VGRTRETLASVPMPFLNIGELPSRERLPGWHGRHFNSESMTFGHWEFEAGASIHEHRHPQEEVWLPIEGELEVTVDGVTIVAGPGTAAMVPPDTPHSIRALGDGKAIVVDHPIRSDF
jgi:quercetin dioxygenase-like cupin family protein